MPISILKKFKAEGKEYIKVEVSNCCNAVYLFEIRPSGFFNLERCEMADKGTAESLNIALRVYDNVQTS